MPRFTVDMDDQFSETLTKLANGGSKADAIRKAVSVYQFLKSEVPNPYSEKRVAITDSQGKVEKIVVLP
jgi:hypothetical protein